MLPFHLQALKNTTIQNILTNVLDKDQSCNRQGVVYVNKYTDCRATYIGETDRNLKARLTEHKRATKNGDIRIESHFWTLSTKLNTNSTGTLLNAALAAKLSTVNDTGKLVHWLRTRTSKPMPTTAYMLQTTHTWPQTKPANFKIDGLKLNNNKTTEPTNHCN